MKLENQSLNPDFNTRFVSIYLCGLNQNFRFIMGTNHRYIRVISVETTLIREGVLI